MPGLKTKGIRERVVEWLYAGVIAVPMIGLYIASRKYGGWVWPTLFIFSVIATIGFGYWNLHKSWQEED